MWRTWRERPLRRSFRSLVSGRWFFAQGRGKQDQPTLGRTPRSSSRSRTASHSSPSPRSRPSSRPARERDSRGTLSSERTSQPANSMRAPALRLRAGLRRAWGPRARRPTFARRGPARNPGLWGRHRTVGREVPHYGVRTLGQVNMRQFCRKRSALFLRPVPSCAIMAVHFNRKDPNEDH